MGQSCGGRCCANYWSWLCCEDNAPNRITLRSGEYETLMDDNFDEFSLEEEMPMKKQEKRGGRGDGRERADRAPGGAVVVQPVAATHHHK
nr:MAG: myristylated tegument protein [Turdid alphaherpesvirus 1]